MSLSPASADAILDQALAETKRSERVVAAAVGGAASGALHVLGALQVWWLTGRLGVYNVIPIVMLAMGVALCAIGSRTFRQHVGAVRALIGVSIFGILGMGLAFMLASYIGLFSFLIMLLPVASIVTLILGAMAYAPCVRTAAARKRAADAGLDIDLT